MIKLRNIMVSILLPTIIMIGTMIFCNAKAIDDSIAYSYFTIKLKWMLFSTALILLSLVFSSLFIYNGLNKTQKGEEQ